VEQTCEQVLIITKGRLVATGAVKDLQNRAKGAGSVQVEVAGRDGELSATAVQKRLEQVPGVSRVLVKETRQNRAVFEVEGQSDRAIRGDLARAVVESGWDLNELRTAAVSLEEVFLQLTGGESGSSAESAGAASEAEATDAKAGA